MRIWKLAALAAAGLAIAGAARAETTISYGTYLAARHNVNVKALEPYFRQVEADTKGSLKFKLYSDGTMVSGRNTLQGIRDGVVDMGVVVDLYVASELKHSALISELALFGEDTMAMNGALNEMQVLHCPGCVADFKRNNVTSWGFFSTSPYYLMCRSEITDLKSLRGKRIRATGPWGVWAAAVGAVPVNITSSEIYEAMERGQVDCSVGSRSWLRSYGLVDVVKYIVDMPLGTYHGASLLDMNLDTWNKRSPEEKAALRRHSAEAVAKTALSYEEEDADAMAEAAKKGIKLIPASDDLRKMIADHKKTEVQRVAELAKRRGVENGEALARTFVELVEKWTRIAQETGGDTQKFAAALQREIYAKMAD